MSFEDTEKIYNIIEQAETEKWTDLDLSQYDIDYLPPEIGKLINLRSLNLYGNFLEFLPSEIRNLRNLITLKLGGNFLTELPNEICELKNLIKLRVDDNKIQNLPVNLGKLENLRHFSACTNAIKNIPMSTSNLHQLETLYLDENQIAELPPNIGRLRGLQTVSIRYNKLKKLPETILDLINLRFLDISHNYLEKIPEILFLEHLEEVHIDHNQIISPPVFYNNHTKLHIFSYENNLFNANDFQNNLPSNLRESINKNKKEARVIQKNSLQVFLCHSSEDKSQVRNFYEKLKEDGFAVWLDEKDLIPGQDWELEISKAISSSDTIIIFLSKNSVAKEGFVQKEIRFALDKAEEKPDGTIFIIPTLLEECEVPNSLKRQHWVKLFEETGYNLLLKALNTRATNLDLK